jgi:molybdopterin converting factor small subunit
MKIRVTYAAQAKVAAGRDSEEIELDEPISVHDLVVRLARQHGAAFGRLALDGRGCPHPALLVVVGDEQVRPGDHRLLKAGDGVTILTPISGG